MRRIACALVVVLLSGGTAAHAQAYQCAAPRSPTPTPVIRPDGPQRLLPVTGYTLALSWSPQFCRNSDDTIQCSGRHGRFGLIVHGLWPEGERGRWPQWCPQGAALSGQIVKKHLCMMPSPRLMAHEWAKHGSCMARRPEAYFAATTILWRSLNLPDLDRLSREPGLTVGDIRQAWTRANPAIGRAGVAVLTGQGGWLKEIRLCYGRDFMPTACSPERRGATDTARVRIWRGL